MSCTTIILALSSLQQPVRRPFNPTELQASRRAAVSPRADAEADFPWVGRPLSTRQSARHGLSLSVLKSVDEVSREQWNALAAPTGSPFVLWDYLHAMEASKSAETSEGWTPQHLVAHDIESGRLVGAVPLYLKSHSYGEYVFDHAWARAYRATAKSGRYYPKLQACVPFTPVTGPRLLVCGESGESGEKAAEGGEGVGKSGVSADGEEKASSRPNIVRRVLVNGLVAHAERLGVSSVHVTFGERDEDGVLERAGFLPRIGLQYHWHNHGYESFDDYLAQLKQSRRKTIRQERRKVADAGIVVRRLRGKQISTRHWDAFFAFYSRLSAQKWGRGYLTRDFFEQLSNGPMAERLLLVVAERTSVEDGLGGVIRKEEGSGELVAGALNLIGEDCLYGRHWGCSQRFDGLHMELCYYQAIEAAIELGLPRVEAGAQGEHKIARGYMPTLTHSQHFLRDPAFERSVATFLRDERERTYIALAQIATKQNPFKRPPDEHLRTQGVKVEGKRIIVE